MFETNSIIRASAGTGKTFALATRFIRLMLLDGVKPETIVALTFSRAAAQEIYTKILDRLCAAATDDAHAEREWENLLDDFRQNRIADSEAKLAQIEANPPPHVAADFASLLRKLVDTQHLGAIATLDSFILKIVRNFPKEMGVQNAVSVLDPIDENAAVDDAVKSALAKTGDSAKNVAEAFRATQHGDYPRQCLEAIGTILVKQGWRDFVLAHPECIQQGTRWTVESMAAQLGVDLTSVCPDLSVLPGGDPLVDRLVAKARDYDGATTFISKDKVQGTIDFFWGNPDAAVYTHDFNRHHYDYPCTAQGARLLHDTIRHMMNVYLKRQLEIVAAKIALVEAVEREYERMTRRTGKLTFADFTKYSAEDEFSRRGIALKNVEFRFDSKFDHWALDEFQDTSELQWRCLRELVQNAAEEGHEGGTRTAMAVGDMKQSIYTWRGASARPFEDLAGWEAFTGFERDFDVSHRYGPNIADFVNKVFGQDNIQMGSLIKPECADAVNAWQRGWRDHVSHEAPDYVKVVEAASDDDPGEDNEILPVLLTELKTFWDRHQAENSTDTMGVLVRNNDNGLKVADYLRRHGLKEVVWEGMNPCSDDPVVQAVLALLKLADHPSDTAAWKTVDELFGLRTMLLPNCRDCASVSEAVVRLLTQQGLARTLKDWCGMLRADGRIAEDGLTGEKLRQLVALAVAFEGRSSGDGSVSAFIDFVKESGKREIAASSGVIRILTIHRSKGLGIDHVFVPLFENSRSQSAIDAPNGRMPLYDGGNWVLSHLSKGDAQFNDRTWAAYGKMCGERFAESLRTYYVALTRAKKSMVIVVPQEENEPPDTDRGLLMRDLVKRAVGGRLPYEAGEPPSFRTRQTAVSGRPHEVWSVDAPRVCVKRATPSQGPGKQTGRPLAVDVFDPEFGEAAQKGIDAHAAYAKIEWIDPAAPQGPVEKRILSTGFRPAFVKSSPEATVWRERSYERFNAELKCWESGQFDRVVFSGEGPSRSATIFDFKTNARRNGESEQAFAERMRTLYSSQMTAYREALSQLTRIPKARIGLQLLLEATGQAVAL